MKKITLCVYLVLNLISISSAQEVHFCGTKEVELLNENFVNKQFSNPSNYPIKEFTQQQFLAMQLPQSEFDLWVSGPYNYGKIEPISKQIYSIYRDNFDFLIFVLDQVQTRNGIYGQLINVSNKVKGIGLTVHTNNSAAEAYGSAGNLKSCIVIPGKTYIENGPFLHEIAHNWANHGFETIFPQEANPCNSQYGAGDCYRTSINYHWGASGCGGQLGGFDQSALKTNVDGIPNKFQGLINGKAFGFNDNGANSLRYSDFELYLMGLKPLSAVAPFDVFTDIMILTTDRTGNGGYYNGKFFGNSKVRYDNAKILSQLGGERIPNNISSQKDFKALIVFLTTTNLSTLTSNSDVVISLRDQLERMSRKSDNGNSSFNFWEATQGLGTLSFDLSTSQLSIVDNEFKNALQIYPNPVKNSFQIQVEDEGVFQIYGVEGKLVSEQKVIVGDQKIDMTHLSKGLYIGKLGRKSVKIIKE